MASVRFTAREIPAGSARRDFGRTLFIQQADTSATDLDTIVRDRQLRRYGNAAAVEDDWPIGHPVRAAAARYFAQVPFPGPMLTGGWFDADVVGRVIGGSPGTVTAIRAVGSSVLQFGASATAAINFATPATFAAIATAVQTALAAVISNATCAYSSANARFECTFPAAANISGGFTDNAASRALGLFSAIVLPGIEDEANISGAASRLNANERDWYGVSIDPAQPLAQRAFMKTWAEANKKLYSYDMSDVSALTANETTSEAALDFAAQRRRTFGVWSRTADQKALSLMGRFASIDFRNPGSYITAKFKLLPGCNPDVLSDTERAELTRKRINFYAPDVGQPGIVAEGTTYGTWIDHVVFLDWITDAVEVAMGNLAVASNTIPQDDSGRGRILREIDMIGSEARASGGLSPGEVSEPFAAEIRQVTGNPNFDGILTQGYLPYVAPFTPAVRAQGRIAPPTYLFGRFAGAVHDIEGSIVFGL